MLIEKKDVLAAGDVVSFRINSGEEILAKLTAIDEVSITVSKPVIVQMQMVSQTQAGLGFVPFMATADDTNAKFRFERTKLMCDPIAPRADIKGQYIKMTTGLEMVEAPKSLLKV